MEEENSDGEETPQLALAFFGYDRFQVDEYISQLLACGERARQRAVKAEQSLAELEAEVVELRARPVEAAPPDERDRPLEPEREEAARHAASVLSDLSDELDRVLDRLDRLEQDLAETTL